LKVWENVRVTKAAPLQNNGSHQSDWSTIQPRPRPSHLVLCSYVIENRFEEAGFFGAE